MNALSPSLAADTRLASSRARRAARELLGKACAFLPPLQCWPQRLCRNMDDAFILLVLNNVLRYAVARRPPPSIVSSVLDSLGDARKVLLPRGVALSALVDCDSIMRVNVPKRARCPTAVFGKQHSKA